MQDRPIKIASYPIKLGQFLKLAEIASDGFEAKLLISNGEITVNGVVETRRGKQLKQGDVISSSGIVYRCD